MKKIMLALLSILLCFSLFSCTLFGGTEEENPTEKEDSSFKGDVETPFVDLEFN